MVLDQLSGKHEEKIHGKMLLKVRFCHQNVTEVTCLTREAVTRDPDKLQKDGLVSPKK